mgnify:CR=1 FL=1
MKKQQIKETRQFLGIWIPREIYLNKDLNWTDKILVVEINSLDNERGCFASNEYFAEFLSVSTTTISTSISKLKSLGLIEQVSFDGRTRILKAAIKQIENPPLNKLKSRNKANLKHNKTNNKTIYNNISKRELKFINDVSLISEFNIDLKENFCQYWCERNSSKTKMRFEMEKIFDIKKRLARWKSNDSKWNKPKEFSKVGGKQKSSKTQQSLNTWQNARTMLDNLNLPNDN